LKDKPPQPVVLKQPIKAVKRARAMRSDMSLPEVLLWTQLRQRPGGCKFRRQVPAQPYTLDFACLSARLAIEVDGEAHNRGDQPQRDAVRDRVMAERGFRTLRLTAWDVLNNMDGCVMMIASACEQSSPERGGGPAGDGGVPCFGMVESGEGGPPPSAAPPPPRAGEDLEDRLARAGEDLEDRLARAGEDL
jgi:very-short-patch-repair endonuclease